ncbi:MAG: chemotaxis response regulator protein-glutamate methylesterase [Proteobacteria bacterium]|nr:chemotaxis response regulator protein-glutamate methylesterase [Pseudomonadota bacterium]
MRIAIVNDMKMAVEVMRRIITTVQGYEVAWIAKDGKEAVSRCADDVPDLILMDLIMPEMNGVEASRNIMANSPCPILVVTASVTANAAKVFEAMSVGALDAVSTPILGTSGEADGKNELLKKIRTIGKLIDADRKKTSLNLSVSPKPDTSDKCLLALGASTGGPAALIKILSTLPKDLPAAVVIVQHVDENFSQGFADWLGEYSKLPVRLAMDGDRLNHGTVLVAGTNNHLYINERSCLVYKENPLQTPYRPSVDVFFNSILKNWGGKAVAALLTGMGKDGADGLLQLKQNGIYTVAQNAETCRVYGMPKAAVELNAAVDILPIDDIAEALTKKILAYQIKSK